MLQMNCWCIAQMADTSLHQQLVTFPNAKARGAFVQVGATTEITSRYVKDRVMKGRRPSSISAVCPHFKLQV